MLVLLLGASVYVLVGFPSNIAAQWGNPKQWQGNPQNSPPGWVGDFTPDYPATIGFSSVGWSNNAPPGAPHYNFSHTFTFQWTSAETPSNIVFIPRFNGTFIEAAITWTKPDGDSLVIYIGNPGTNVNYGVADPSIAPWIQQYVGSQMGTTP